MEYEYHFFLLFYVVSINKKNTHPLLLLIIFFHCMLIKQKICSPQCSHFILPQKFSLPKVHGQVFAIYIIRKTDCSRFPFLKNCRLVCFDKNKIFISKIRNFFTILS